MRCTLLVALFVVFCLHTSSARPALSVIKATPWINCGTSSDHVTLSGVSVVIAPPPTSSVTVGVGGIVDEIVYGGLYVIDITLKSVPIQVYSGPISQLVSTPVAKGKFNIEHSWNFGLEDTTFRKSLEAANVTAPFDYGYMARLTARDQNYEILFCIQAEA